MHIYDLHIHIKKRSVCSRLDLQTLFYELSPKFEGICITDHEDITPISDVEQWELPVYFGTELTTKEGDILIYGVSKLPPKYYDVKQIINWTHDQGGIVVAAHPFSERKNCLKEKIFEFEFDALEINGSLSKRFHKPVFEAANMLDIPTIGGSDAHNANQLNTIGTFFQNPIRSYSDLIKGIQEKNCKAIKI